MHWIAKQVAEATSIPWIADFRDPWTNIDFYKELHLSRWADRKHHKMELAVLQSASEIITISESMASDFNRIHPRSYEVITNGFDEDDLGSADSLEPDEKFSIAHIGTLVSSRNPEILWQVLQSILKEVPDFSSHLQIKLAGRVDFSVMESIDRAGLSQFTERINYLPHAEVIKIQQRSQVLLLLVNNTPNSKSILTGKIFEYLAAKRPILCIAPADGDAAKIIQETNSGLISDFNDFQSLKENILVYYRLYQNGLLKSQSSNIEKYSRKALTGKLAEVMNKAIGNRQ
jgi:glycosyltransferase involved in cell wall biosynthesis